jgi:hypothetical protein
MAEPGRSATATSSPGTERQSVFNPPPPQPSDESAKQHADTPDLAVLFLLWVFYLVIGPIMAYAGYWPPPFKPRWLYKALLSSVIAIWIGLVTIAWFFNTVEILTAAIVILVCIVALGIVLLRADEKEKGKSGH